MKLVYACILLVRELSGVAARPKCSWVVNQWPTCACFRTLDISLPRNARSAAAGMPHQQPEPHPAVLRDIEGLPNLQNPDNVQPVSSVVACLACSIQFFWPMASNAESSWLCGECLHACITRACQSCTKFIFTSASHVGYAGHRDKALDWCTSALHSRLMWPVSDIDQGFGAGAVQAALPLQLAMFGRVPVVVSARQHSSSGRPAEPFARLYLAA